MQQREIQLRKSDNTEQLRREAATMRRGNAPATPAEKSQRALYEASRQRAVESYWGTALPAAAPPSPEK